MPRICLDPGHGGTDPGARTTDGRQEKETNLRVALKVEALLRRHGLDVLITRRDDSSVSLPARCKLANDWGADVFVSLHADAGDPARRGHHAICSIHSRPGQGGAKLARLLVDEMTAATGQQPTDYGERGVWSRKSDRDPSRDWYAVIRETRMSAVILERGFLTNAEDARLMFNNADLDRQAEGIVRGVCAYFGVAFQAPGVAPERPPEAGPSAPPPGAAKVNIALCRPADVDVAIPPAPARLSEIVRGAGQVARSSNANLYDLATGKVLGLFWRDGKFAGRDLWACWKWPVLAVYLDGTAKALPNGWRTPDLAGLRVAVAGAPLLVRDGKVQDIPAAMQTAGIDASIRPNESIPRTAVGVRADGFIVHAVTEAATLASLAAAMIEAGARDAINLDGGGSSGLVEGGKLVAGADTRKLPCALVLRQTIAAASATPTLGPDECWVEIHSERLRGKWDEALRIARVRGPEDGGGARV